MFIAPYLCMGHDGVHSLLMSAYGPRPRRVHVDRHTFLLLCVCAHLSVPAFICPFASSVHPFLSAGLSV